MQKKKSFNEIKKNPKNVRFHTLCKVTESFGFVCRGGKGSHRVYIRRGCKEILNFQNINGKAKPYQVRQFIKIIEKYSLMEEENEE